MKILNDTERAEVINVYDISTEKSIDITEQDKIEKYVNALKNLKLKKIKLVGNSSAKGIIIILKDEDGDVIDTLYLSEKELVYHNWLVRITDGINPYEELVEELNK